MSISTCVRSRACAFSYVTSCFSSEWPISRKCTLTASWIFTSWSVAPSFFVKTHAFWYVLSVVPKQGIVTASMQLLSIPCKSNAFAVTSNANVESNPPEIPTTALLQLVWFRRFFSPIAWIIKDSSQHLFLRLSFSGTNGNFSKVLVSFVSSTSIENGTRINRSKSSSIWKVVFFLLSLTIRSTSISL